MRHLAGLNKGGRHLNAGPVFALIVRSDRRRAPLCYLLTPLLFPQLCVGLAPLVRWALLPQESRGCLFF